MTNVEPGFSHELTKGLKTKLEVGPGWSFSVDTRGSVIVSTGQSQSDGGRTSVVVRGSSCVDFGREQKRCFQREVDIDGDDLWSPPPTEGVISIETYLTNNKVTRSK